MHAENLLINERCDGEAVEDVAEDSPESNGVSTLALIVEAIDAIDLSALVIASQEEEVLGVLDLVAEEKADCLDRLLSTVDVVTEEKIVGLRWEPTILEDSQKIVVLSVHIT